MAIEVVRRRQNSSAVPVIYPLSRGSEASSNALKDLAQENHSSVDAKGNHSCVESSNSGYSEGRWMNMKKKGQSDSDDDWVGEETRDVIEAATSTFVNEMTDGNLSEDEVYDDSNEHHTD